jgi:hypothetical protein
MRGANEITKGGFSIIFKESSPAFTSFWLIDTHTGICYMLS